MAKRHTTTHLRVPGIGIALLQLFDIAIHTATGQLELLRIFSNAIILLWLAVLVSEKLHAKVGLAAISAVGAYLILNLVFLAREGLTNPEKGGGLRVLLLLLVFLTVTASSGLAFWQNRQH